MNETWRKIEEVKDYYVSDLGNIYSNASNKVLTPVLGTGGYYIVSLNVSGKFKTRTIHRLVVLAFTPNPNGRPQINHIDGDKSNNHVDNLEWCTSQENIRHAFKIGLRDNVGMNNPHAKLTANQVDEIKVLLNKGYTQDRIAKMFNAGQMTISRINNGEHHHQITTHQ